MWVQRSGYYHKQITEMEYDNQEGESQKVVHFLLDKLG
jgi:hypothetical protein